MASDVKKFFLAKGKFLFRYDRSHPHFKWFLGIDAIVSILLVTGLFMFMTNGSNSARGLLIESSGATALTSDQLTKFVKSEKIVAYWLGPISGSMYTIVTTTSGKITISYLSGGLGIERANQRNLVIETIIGIHKGALVAPTEQVDTATDITVTGNTFSYNKLKLDQMNVRVNVTKKDVLVYYPTLRSPLTMQTDAEALELIG